MTWTSSSRNLTNASALTVWMLLSDEKTRYAYVCRYVQNENYDTRMLFGCSLNSLSQKNNNFCAHLLAIVFFSKLSSCYSGICHTPTFCNLCPFRKKSSFVLLPFWSYVYVRLYSVAILKLLFSSFFSHELFIKSITFLWNYKLVLNYYAFLFFVMIGKLKNN